MFEYLTYSEQKALFSVSEAARVLNVSYSTVLRLIHSGKLPTVIIGKRNLIKAADLNNYIQAHSR
jgi:DNA binding domain, excisionase family